MKKIIILALSLLTANASAITWSYKVIDNKDKGTEFKLDSAPKIIKVDSDECLVTETEIQKGAEFRVLSCKLGGYKVSINVACTEGDSDFQVLHIHNGKSYNRVQIFCKGT